MAAMGRSISRLKCRRIAAARVLPSDWICACETVRTTASATEQRNETASDQRTTSARVAIRRSRAPLCARELSLLLLEVLRDGARTLDGELLHLAIRRACER